MLPSKAIDGSRLSFNYSLKIVHKKGARRISGAPLIILTANSGQNLNFNPS